MARRNGQDVEGVVHAVARQRLRGRAVFALAGRGDEELHWLGARRRHGGAAERAGEIGLAAGQRQPREPDKAEEKPPQLRAARPRHRLKHPRSAVPAADRRVAILRRSFGHGCGESETERRPPPRSARSTAERSGCWRRSTRKRRRRSSGQTNSRRLAGARARRPGRARLIVAFSSSRNRPLLGA